MNKEYLINIYNNTKEITKNYPIDKSYEYIIQHIKEYPENKIKYKIIYL